jgi:TRAP-type C4-dicarboxylate transport system permease small subunit
LNNIIQTDAWIKKISKTLSFIGSVWIFVIMIVIALDVCGRTFFNAPLTGTAEIARNSVVGIAFFMIPWATATDRHVRSTILVDMHRIPVKIRHVLQIIAYAAGLVVFIGMIYSSWEPLLHAYVFHEFEGEGALRIPTWPVRAVIVLGCLLACWHNLLLLLSYIVPKQFGFIQEQLADNGPG